LQAVSAGPFFSLGGTMLLCRAGANAIDFIRQAEHDSKVTTDAYLPQDHGKFTGTLMPKVQYLLASR
jgi:hypothetical protein